MKTKRSLAEFTIESCKMRKLKDRLDVANAVMMARSAMGNPVQLEELPDDLAEILADPSKI